MSELTPEAQAAFDAALENPTQERMDNLKRVCWSVWIALVMALQARDNPALRYGIREELRREYFGA